MLTDFRKTLDKFKVPQKEHAELVTIVESTKKDIVEPALGGRLQDLIHRRNAR